MLKVKPRVSGYWGMGQMGLSFNLCVVLTYSSIPRIWKSSKIWNCWDLACQRVCVDICNTSTYIQVTKIPKWVPKGQAPQGGAYMHVHSLNPKYQGLLFRLASNRPYVDSGMGPLGYSQDS